MLNLVEFFDEKGVLCLEHGYTIKGQSNVGYVLHCGGNFVFFHQDLSFVLNRYTRLVSPDSAVMYEVCEGN